MRDEELEASTSNPAHENGIINPGSISCADDNGSGAKKTKAEKLKDKKKKQKQNKQLRWWVVVGS